MFDSRLLGREDLFITHVMRPGNYAIRNIKGEGHADLRVEYPEHGKLAWNMQPIAVKCNDGK